MRLGGLEVGFISSRRTDSNRQSGCETVLVSVRVMSVIFITTLARAVVVVVFARLGNGRQTYMYIQSRTEQDGVRRGWTSVEIAGQDSNGPDNHRQ